VLGRVGLAAVGLDALDRDGEAARGFGDGADGGAPKISSRSRLGAAIDFASGTASVGATRAAGVRLRKVQSMRCIVPYIVLKSIKRQSSARYSNTSLWVPVRCSEFHRLRTPEKVSAGRPIEHVPFCERFSIRWRRFGAAGLRF
jgi:hypothetical protein